MCFLTCGKLFLLCKVSPQSNNAYNQLGTSGTMNVSIKGGAILTPALHGFFLLLGDLSQHEEKNYVMASALIKLNLQNFLKD